MARHPGIVPHQHHHGGAQHAGIEQLLARAFEGARNALREQRDDAGAECAEPDAETDPGAAVGHAPGRGHHDADDQTGLDGLAKNDDECAEHAAIPRSRHPWRCRR